MLTPQDIQTKEFPKAVFGGYDMTAVDDFLEELEADYTALYKDNAVLKGKLKVLVDKVEEYRSTEDAMRMALMTAQKMSDDMLAETKKKCEDMVKQAQEEANSQRNKINSDISAEETKLAAAKTETARFINAAKKLVEDQARFLLRLDKFSQETLKEVQGGEQEPIRSPEPEPGESVPAARQDKPASEEDDMADTVREIDDVVADIIQETKGNPPEERSSVDLNKTGAYDPSLEETKRMPAINEKQVSKSTEEPAASEEDDEEVTPRPKFKFDDLQFGTNYKEDKK